MLIDPDPEIDSRNRSRSRNRNVDRSRSRNRNVNSYNHRYNQIEKLLKEVIILNLLKMVKLLQQQVII